MRSSYTKDEMLLAAAKKKPRLQALIDSVAQMTEADIDALSEALWVREALKILKLSGGKGQKERLQDIVRAADEADAKARAMPKPTYEVRLWDGGETFLGTNKGDRDWQIQIDYQDSFMIVDDEFVRFGDSVVAIGAFDRYPLMQSSRLVGYMTLENYKGFHRALLNKKHPIV
jgi:hypothetical protein